MCISLAAFASLLANEGLCALGSRHLDTALTRIRYVIETKAGVMPNFFGMSFLFRVEQGGGQYVIYGINVASFCFIFA